MDKGSWFNFWTYVCPLICVGILVYVIWIFLSDEDFFTEMIQKRCKWGAFAFIILAILSCNAIARFEVKVKPDDVIQKSDIEYLIIKGKQRREIKGSGLGLLTYYQMNFGSNDTFTFYYKNKNNEIERKKVDFDFVIKETDEDKVYFRIYHKYTVSHYCNLYTNKCWKSESKKERFSEKRVLYVPKGTIQEEPIKLD